LQKSVRKTVEAVGLRNMAVQRSSIELGKDHDFFDVPMEAIGNRDIDQAELAADGNCRLGTVFGQGIESGSPAAAKNNR
jgi:hypothetical protein